MTASGWRSGDDEGASRGDKRSRYRDYSDRALVDAMRSFDADALEEFIERFQHLVLLQARRLRVRPEDRQGWASELLYDVASSLAREPQRSAPRALIPYLITACKRKALAARRNLAVRERTDTGLMGDVGGAGESALLATCSEDAVRGTYGPDMDPLPLAPVLERLVSILGEGASAAEVELLSWLAHRTSYRVIAASLGITRPAAIKRATRLRARLVDAAMRFGTSLGREDREELLRFFRRCGTFTEADLEVLGRPALEASEAQDDAHEREQQADDEEEDGTP